MEKVTLKHEQENVKSFCTTTGTIVAAQVINYYSIVGYIVSGKGPKIIRSAMVKSKLWSFTGSLISRIRFMRPKVCVCSNLAPGCCVENELGNNG